MKTVRHLGNKNMRGKKTVRMRCGCCVARNLKDWYFKKLAEKEIKEKD